MTRPAPAWRTQRPYLAEAIVCDGLLPWTEVYLPPGADLPTQLRRFWHNGVDHISLTAAAGRDGPLDALKRLGHLRNTIGAHDWIQEASAPDAIRAARTSGQLSVSYHFQSATPFIPPYGAPDLDLVDAFKGAGIIRSILAYNEANVFADGCHEPRDAGLSTYGHRLIQRMDSAGMVIDLSHCGPRTTFDALNAALRRPPSSPTPTQGRFTTTNAISPTRKSRPAATRGVMSASTASACSWVPRAPTSPNASPNTPRMSPA